MANSGLLWLPAMKPIKKVSAVELAAGALRDLLREGVLPDRLPGTRVLAERMGLSAPTVAAALVRLAEEGLVAGGGPRRAFRVVGPSGLEGGPHRPLGHRDLLIITHEETGRLVDSTRRLLDLLQRKLRGQEWQVRFQVIDFFHVKKPQAWWDRVIELEEDTRVIGVYGRRPLAAWAAKRKVKLLFLGGDSGDIPVPKVAVSSARMAEQAMERLTQLGHQRIVLPLCDRTESFKHGMREVTRRAVEKAGGTYVKGYHNPESDYLAPDVTWRILEAVFSKQSPTALVLIDWKEVVAAHCFLAQAGLKVPRDVSMVVLSDSVTAEWFHPKLCRFRFPQDRLLAEMVKWLEDKPGSEKGATLSGIFVDGDTIGPPVSDGG
jgi:hypothetical protein